MAIETLYQGNLDVFLAKVRADFDAVEDQALKSTRALQDWSLVSTDPNANTLYTMVSAGTPEGDRAVWRNVSVAGVQQLGTRMAGGLYPEAKFIRGYETAVFDPNVQVAGRFIVPEERDAKEAIPYKTVLNRAQKLLYEIDRQNIADLFELFNQAFTTPTAYPVRFFAKGNYGLDGNYTALNENFISTQHARADGGTTQSNALVTSGLMNAFTDVNYWAAREQGATIVDDVGKPMPMFGGKVTLIVPPANNLVRTATEIDRSEWKVLTANNEINIHEGMFTTIKSSPYLLQSYYSPSTLSYHSMWYLCDDYIRDPETGTSLVKIAFVPLNTRVEHDQAVDATIYKVKEEYVYGWTDWRNFVGSKGDNSAYAS